MKTLKLLMLVFILVCGMNAMAQEGGVEFRDLSLEQAKQLAKQEKKLVFIGFSMNGCSPCKYMKEKVFVLPEIGKYYNEHFICLYINVSVNEEGAELARSLRVNAFPTFVFMNPENGEPVHVALGGQRPEVMLQIGKIALIPNQGSVYLNNEYISGNRDYDFLVDYYLMCQFEGDRAKMKQVIDDMVKLWGADFKNPKMNDFFFECVFIKDNPLMDYFLKNTKKMIKKFGKEKVFEKIEKVR